MSAQLIWRKLKRTFANDPDVIHIAITCTGGTIGALTGGFVWASKNKKIGLFDGFMLVTGGCFLGVWAGFCSPIILPASVLGGLGYGTGKIWNYCRRPTSYF